MSLKFKREDGKILVLGNTFPIKDKLKSHGAKFQGESKTWVLTESPITLELMDKLGAFELDDMAPLLTKERSAALRISEVSAKEEFFINSKTDKDSPSDIRISELVNLAQKSLAQSFPVPIWVVGEIHNIQQKNSAVFLTFSESKENSNKDIASIEIRTVMWAETAKKIKTQMGPDVFESLLVEGTQVRAKVSVSLYKDRAQLSLQILELDASYTQGAIAKARADLIKELTSKGLDRRNKELNLPDFPLRIGLISSLGSRAYSDFLDQLLSLHFCGQVVFCNAATQGDEVTTSVCKAIDFLHNKNCDLIVITRGGGSAADLRWFDSRDIAYKIAESNIPILAAIGHHDDVSVAEIIAHTRQKTPTAAADFILQIQHATLKKLQNFMLNLHQFLLWRRDSLNNQVNLLSNRLRSASNQSLQKRILNVQRQQHHFKFLLQKKSSTLESHLKQLFYLLEKNSLQFFTKHSEIWMQLEKKLLSLDPSPWLKEGWTRLIFPNNRKTIKSVTELENHHILEARLLDGSLTLEVKSIHSKQDSNSN